MAMTCPLRSTGITLLHHYYGAVRPSPAHRYFRPRGWRRLCLFPWHRRPGSHVPYKSPIEVRAAYMPDAAWAVPGIPQADPEAGPAPGFDIAYSPFDTSAAVRLRSPPSTMPDGIMSRLFRNVHHRGF